MQGDGQLQTAVDCVAHNLSSGTSGCLHHCVHRPSGLSVRPRTRGAVLRVVAPVMSALGWGEGRKMLGAPWEVSLGELLNLSQKTSQATAPAAPTKTQVQVSAPMW